MSVFLSQTQFGAGFYIAFHGELHERTESRYRIKYLDRRLGHILLHLVRISAHLVLSIYKLSQWAKKSPRYFRARHSKSVAY